MSRTRFWTILLGTEPTAFHAADRDTLVPTLKQLQRRHPEAVLKWFERGQIFESPREADEARARVEAEKRPKEWRPGGAHRDPRARFQKTRDEKRRLFKSRMRRASGPAGQDAGPRQGPRAPAGPRQPRRDGPRRGRNPSGEE